jgi:hypothetical protein
MTWPSISDAEIELLAKGDSEWAEIKDVQQVALELLKLRRIVAAYQSGGFSDADAMAIAYLGAREEITKLRTALADIQEIADRETNNEAMLIDEIVRCSMAALAK